MGVIGGEEGGEKGCGGGGEMLGDKGGATGGGEGA